MTGDYEDRLATWSDIQGHLSFLYRTVSSRESPVVAEFGVRTGNSTCAFLAAARENKGSVWSVDVAAPQVPSEWWGWPEWHFLRADSLSPEAARFIPATLDVLFIDDHDSYWTAEEFYAHIAAELDEYLPRVVHGGVALLHDTQWAAPQDIDLGSPVGPVGAAISRYCDSKGLEWFNRTESFGMGVIQVRKSKL